MEWRPICDASKTRYSTALVDLWIDSECGYREENCWWNDSAGCWENCSGRMYVTGDMATHFMAIEPPKKNGE